MMLELKMMEPLLLLIVYLLVSCHCSPAINRTSPYYQKLVALVGNGKVDAVNPLSLFKVEEILGAGTFAKVFKVQSKKRMQARPTGTAQNADSFPTSIALKQMRLDSDEYIKYSINEVIIGRQILKLKIRNVMKYRDFYLYKDKLFMVMDFVPGVNLDSLNPRVFTPLLVVKVTQDLLETVLELNKAGICHVDLGASNIMMDGHGTITIVDFGLAQTIIPSFGDISGEEDFKYTTHCTDEKKAVQMLLDVIRHYFKAQGLILSQEDKGGNLLVKQLERMLNKVKYGQWSIERVLKHRMFSKKILLRVDIKDVLGDDELDWGSSDSTTSSEGTYDTSNTSDDTEADNRGSISRIKSLSLSSESSLPWNSESTSQHTDHVDNTKNTGTSSSSSTSSTSDKDSLSIDDSTSSSDSTSRSESTTYSSSGSDSTSPSSGK